MTSFPNPELTPEFTGDNGITYSWDATDGKWVVKGFSTEADPRYVKKVGGDSMEGPLQITNNPDIVGSRESRKIETLGVFSNSEGSALRLGTTRDRIYVGHNDTSFNGPIKVDELQEKNANNGVKVSNTLKLQQNSIKELAYAVDERDALPYGQFIEELQDFRDNLVQDLSFGTWSYSSNNVTPIQTRFYARGSNGVTSNVSASLVDTLIFNVEDLYGNTAPFDRVDVGELFTLTRDGVVLKYRVNTAPTVSGSQNDGRVVGVNFISQSQSVTLTEGQVWNVQLTEFTDISVDELDDTYLRLDTSNDPLENTLKIHSTDFGEAKLVLRGKRDNANNTCGTVEFNNELETDGNKIGYLTYYNKNSTQYFRFNKDVNLDGSALKAVGNLQIYNEGSIDAGSTPRIILRNPTQGGDGGDYGAVSIRRAINWRRSFTIRGNVDGAEDDIFYANTTADGTDGVIYKGHTGFEYNILNRKALTDALENFEVSSTLEHTPFIAHLDGTVQAVNKSAVGRKEVAGFYTSSNAAGSSNPYLGNWNSYIGCGLAVVATQSGTNNYADLPAGYDEEWLGTVTIFDKNSGGMKYKNTLYRVQRVDDVIRLWVRPTGSTNGKKPIFGIGQYDALTDISVVVEGYRLASA